MRDSNFTLTTARLQLRPLTSSDIDDAVRLGADERVMAVFGGAADAAASADWLEHRLAHWRAHSFGRFHVSHECAFVGFVGLEREDFDAGIVPGVEMAWRLAFTEWGKGYATEAARAVIADAFGRIGLAEVVAVTTPDNTRSRRVAERLGMTWSGETFEHPRVATGDPRRTHVVYRLARGS
jgi:ribosomal-protein-alanine N-acetyltransferase